MKKYTVLLFCLLLCSLSFSQVIDTTQSKTVNVDLLRKSKNQRTAGSIFLGVGSACVLTGLVLLISGTESEPGELNFNGPVGSGALLIGLATAAVSIPFFTASSKNKSKATNLSAGIKAERMPFNQVSASYPSYYPAVSARLKF